MPLRHVQLGQEDEIQQEDVGILTGNNPMPGKSGLGTGLGLGSPHLNPGKPGWVKRLVGRAQAEN